MVEEPDTPPPEEPVPPPEEPAAPDTPEAQGVPGPATGTGTSTGSTTLAVSAVTGSVAAGTAVTGTGVPAGTTIVRQLSGPTGKAGNYLTSAATTLDAVALTFTVGPTLSSFPMFTPIIPPPAIGGGPPPNFPPPTPPPIGAVPVGPLVGPAIAAAPVPPSVAGFTQPQFKTGSAILPLAGGYFPKFTSTFPSPPVVFSNLYTGGKPPVTPPFMPSTINVVLNGWGPNVPPGAPTSPGADGRLPRATAPGEDPPPEQDQQPPEDTFVAPKAARSSRRRAV